jgi:hypothetical protein
MAAPNIVNVTTITGKTSVLLPTTVATSIANNIASSGEVFKINSLIIANINGTAVADATVDIFRSSTAYRIASTVTIPADASLVVISKENVIYLEEGDDLRITASANSYLSAVCSYEEIA